MSLMYSILKPVVRKFIKESSLHRESSYEEFKQESYKAQAKYSFSLPKIEGIEFRDEMIDGSHVIVGKKAGTSPKRAIVYFVGGGSRKWQLPYKSSMKNYITRTGAELWIPLYPLLPDNDLIDEAEFTIKLHEHMLERFPAERIIWFGFSGGADVIMLTGRHMVETGSPLPMPGMMIPVSASGLIVSEETKARMREYDKRDPILNADLFDTMIKYYDPNGDLPQYILGKANEDNYTGFPKIIMYFAGDEVFAGIAPDFESSFIRSGVRDFDIRIIDNVPHAWPVFTFLKEGREGERDLIVDMNRYFRTLLDKNA